MSSKNHFNVGDSVVYPSYGIGKIIDQETKEYNGMKLLVYVISFEKKSMTLRVPLSRIKTFGIRPLSSEAFMQEAFTILSGKKIKRNRSVWSQRIQHYESEMKSGSVVAVAKIIKELHELFEKNESSYSERILYNNAFDIFAHEYAETSKIALEDAINIINKKLN